MSGIPDALVTFVQVLAEDEDLRAWFESFADTPEVQRSVEFQKLAARMQAGGEAEELVRATALLANPEIYRGAQAALEEARHNR